MSDYSEHFEEDSFWQKLKGFASKAGRKVVWTALVLYYCFRDPDTPVRAKGVIAGALGYFIFPLDAIVDVTPAIGYADDLGALTLALTIVAAHIKPEHKQKADDRLREWFGDRSE